MFDPDRPKQVEISWNPLLRSEKIDYFEMTTPKEFDQELIYTTVVYLDTGSVLEGVTVYILKDRHFMCSFLIKNKLFIIGGSPNYKNDNNPNWSLRNFRIGSPLFNR